MGRHCVVCHPAPARMTAPAQQVVNGLVGSVIAPGVEVVLHRAGPAGSRAGAGPTGSRAALAEQCVDDLPHRVPSLMAADRRLRGLPRGSHRLDQRPLLIGQVGVVGLAPLTATSPARPWPPTGPDTVLPHAQVTTRHLHTLARRGVHGRFDGDANALISESQLLSPAASVVPHRKPTCPSGRTADRPRPGLFLSRRTLTWGPNTTSLKLLGISAGHERCLVSTVDPGHTACGAASLLRVRPAGLRVGADMVVSFTDPFRDQLGSDGSDGGQMPKARRMTKSKARSGSSRRRDIMGAAPKPTR